MGFGTIVNCTTLKGTFNLKIDHRKEKIMKKAWDKMKVNLLTGIEMCIIYGAILIVVIYEYELQKCDKRHSKEEK